MQNYAIKKLKVYVENRLVAQPETLSVKSFYRKPNLKKQQFYTCRMGEKYVNTINIFKKTCCVLVEIGVRRVAACKLL